MKTLLRLSIVLVVLPVVAALGAVVFIDHLAQMQIEKGGSRALGVATTVDDADIGLFRGEFTIKGLTIANPPGYSAPHFLSVDRAQGAVGLKTLRQDLVELPSLHLTGLDLILEKHEGKANYQVITDNMKRFETGAQEPAGKRFVIREVVIRDITVHAELLPVPIGGSLTRTDVAIEEIRLTDVGSDSDGGMLVSQLMNILVKAVLVAVIDRGWELPADVKDGLIAAMGTLGSLGDIGVTIIGAAGEVIGGAAGEVGKAAGGAGKTIENLLDGGKKYKDDDK